MPATAATLSRREGREPPTTRKPEDLLRPTSESESDGKGFRRTMRRLVGILFLLSRPISDERKDHEEASRKKKDVIAYRKSCKAKGTGLSHYILMDRKAK